MQPQTAIHLPGSRAVVLGRIARAGVVAVLLSLLTFCLTLLASILVLIVRGYVVGSRPDMTLAYRNAALPAALVALPLAFAGYFAWERRKSSRT